LTIVVAFYVLNHGVTLVITHFGCWTRMFSGCASAVHSSVRSSRQMLFPQYLMNALSNLNETYREYTAAPTDNRNRFWKLKVKGQSQSRPSS